MDKFIFSIYSQDLVQKGIEQGPDFDGNEFNFTSRIYQRL